MCITYAVRFYKFHESQGGVRIIKKSKLSFFLEWGRVPIVHMYGGGGALDPLIVSILSFIGLFLGFKLISILSSQLAIIIIYK